METHEDPLAKLQARCVHLKEMTQRRKDRIAALSDAADAAHHRAERCRDQAERARRRLDELWRASGRLSRPAP